MRLIPVFAHPIRATLLAFAFSSVLAIGAAAGVLAGGGNPAGTGQPGVECGEEESILEPHGFLTDGFANAEERYAGSEESASLAHAASDHAVSQYDVACLHFTASHEG
jgi:hypothetical protein